MRERLLIVGALVAVAACSRSTPKLDDADRVALEKAGISVGDLVVYDDLYDFPWRGAESHALAHGRADAAARAVTQWWWQTGA